MAGTGFRSERQLRMADDVGENVVEIVRDAAGESGKRLVDMGSAQRAIASDTCERAAYAGQQRARFVGFCEIVERAETQNGRNLVDVGAAADDDRLWNLRPVLQCV